MRTRGWFLTGLLVVAVLLLVGRNATALIVDHAWFTAMDAPALFWEEVIDSLLLQGGAWVVGSAFAFANLYAVRRTIATVAMQSRVANIEFTSMVPHRRLLSATIILSMIVGALLALPMTNWTDLALVRHGLPFGEIEGILDRDLGFYVYWLPFEEALYLWSLVSIVSLTAMVLVLYALTRSLRLEGRRVAASTHVRRHLSVLGALVLLLLAWSYRLDAFDLLQYGSGPDGLFLHVDHRFTLRVDWLLSAACSLAALVVLRTGWTGQLRAAFLALTLVLVSAIGLRHIAPTVVARTALFGESGRRDQDYVASRALFSRRAFDVDGIRPGAGVLDLPASTMALRTSLWDDRTLIGGLGASLSPVRDARSLDGNADSDSESAVRSPERLGRTMQRQLDATPTGWTLTDGRISALLVRQPVVAGEPWRLSLVDATRPAVQDSALDPLEARSEEHDATWPLVGPGVSGARLIDAADLPGVPGASLSGLRARVAHAWALRDAALLRADTLGARNLRIVTHRDVRQRVERLAPVFVQGDDVYPVRDGDRLYWVLHLYSASDRYPLSQRWQVAGGVFSYFKLAATAVVDASTGRVRFIPVDRPDALARTWMAKLPALFAPATAMPASLVNQLPPATDGATAQLRTFARYGSRLEGSVVRHLPDSVLVGGAPPAVAQQVGANMVMGWSVPLLDAGDEVDGVATATGGAARATYWTSAAVPNRRWRQMLERLGGALDSARAAVPDGARRDNRLRLARPEAVATASGLFVVQPVLWSRGDGSLVVARVGVTDGERVGIGATLAQALAGIGETTVGAPSNLGAPVTLLTPSPEDAPGRLYDSMRQALRRGDWGAFGTAFDSLGRVLGRTPP
ncbi:MAG TPA: UPF0182 family protein [Gemmatimonas sp.]|uniref:UPF0182 family protein n=1 Tax=Gemmatimonas sp. TaxID=1962908 RepID=UPI002ED7A663